MFWPSVHSVGAVHGGQSVLSLRIVPVHSLQVLAAATPEIRTKWLEVLYIQLTQQARKGFHQDASIMRELQGHPPDGGFKPNPMSSSYGMGSGQSSSAVAHSGQMIDDRQASFDGRPSAHCAGANAFFDQNSTGPSPHHTGRDSFQDAEFNAASDQGTDGQESEKQVAGGTAATEVTEAPIPANTAQEADLLDLGNW